MTSHALRTVAALLAASATLLALAACAPSATVSTPLARATLVPKPKPVVTVHPTSTPTAAPLVEPASRYSFGCDDLMPSARLQSLFAVAMPSIDEEQLERQGLGLGITDENFIGALGGLDCSWTDGKPSASINHEVTLDVLPVTPAEWQRFYSGGDADFHSGGAYIDCESDGGDFGGHSCEYDAYVAGSRIDLQLDNMTPSVGKSITAMPAEVKSLVATITAMLTAAPAAPAAAPQHPAVALPAGAAMLTVAQVHSALGVASSKRLKVQCDLVLDGPWQASDEARNEIMGGVNCAFGTPEVGDSGDAYGLFEFLPAGQWAAAKLASDTPGDVAVSVPGLPAGDSFSEYTDYSGDPWGELVIGGNLIDFTLANPASKKAPGGTVIGSKAMITLAEDFETTIRG